MRWSHQNGGSLEIGTLTSGSLRPALHACIFRDSPERLFGDFPNFRIRSTTTRDRNLQFRGAISTGFFFNFPQWIFFFSSRFSVQFGKEIAPKCGENCPVSGWRKKGQNPVTSLAAMVSSDTEAVPQETFQGSRGETLSRFFSACRPRKARETFARSRLVSCHRCLCFLVLGLDKGEEKTSETAGMPLCQGQILAVWILIANPSSGLNLLWIFLWIFSSCFFPRKKAQKIHRKKSPRIAAEAFS